MCRCVLVLGANSKTATDAHPRAYEIFAKSEPLCRALLYGPFLLSEAWTDMHLRSSEGLPRKNCGLTNSYVDWRCPAQLIVGRALKVTKARLRHGSCPVKRGNPLGLGGQGIRWYAISSA